MYLALSPGALGMHTGSLAEAIALAKETGYGGVEFSIQEAASLIESDGADSVRALFAAAGIRPAGFGLPVAWNGSEEDWKEGLDRLVVYARAAEALGCHRTFTWILSGSNDRTEAENRAFHIERFRPIAEILNAHGCRLGLEFLGPKTIRKDLKYPFVHDTPGMMGLAREIGSNVGLLLDSWHWHTSAGRPGDILRLTARDVVYVHVNDAPPDVLLDDHIDSKRALPGATGVIDMNGFLNALESIGYDGPIVAEPFGNPASWAADLMRAALKRARSAA